MVLSCTSSHTFQIQRADILDRASAEDKTDARAEKRRIEIKEMIFKGTYVSGSTSSHLGLGLEESRLLRRAL